eukprot:s769_g16.t1
MVSTDVALPVSFSTSSRIPHKPGIEGRLQLFGGRAEVSWALPGAAALACGVGGLHRQKRKLAKVRRSVTTREPLPSPFPLVAFEDVGLNRPMEKLKMLAIAG